MAQAFVDAEIEPELQADTPRKLTLRRGAQVGRVILPTICFGFLALIGYGLILDYQRISALAAEGQAIQGHIPESIFLILKAKTTMCITPLRLREERKPAGVGMVRQLRRYFRETRYDLSPSTFHFLHFRKTSPQSYPLGL